MAVYGESALSTPQPAAPQSVAGFPTSQTPAIVTVGSGRRKWLRSTLTLSRQEAAASATTTAVSDNFLNAFAVFLQASLMQMSLLMAIPQLIGAWLQLFAINLDQHLRRQTLVVCGALVQGAAIGGMALLALHQDAGGIAVPVLIAAAVLYHAAANVQQPHWRAWLGSIVPRRRRGAFFAGRTRLTMLITVLIFIGGGALLTLATNLGHPGWGFALLFTLAATGRWLGARFIQRMHDPADAPGRHAVAGTLGRIREAWRDPVFRRYSLFVAGMQGMVAISAPFFAVYMLRDLQFSYAAYALNSVASIGTQFLMLPIWGRWADRYGNRWVMRVSGSLIPVLPLLWLVSPDPLWLIAVQLLSGLAWSGFSLSTANYLYDIRPYQTDFATYAAVQAGAGASAVFCGAILGGVVAAQAGAWVSWWPAAWGEGRAVFFVFALSGMLRAGMALWFLPRAVEPRRRVRPNLMEVVYRVARINAISGVVLDWLTVGRRPRG